MNRIELNSGYDYLDWREGSGGTIEIFDILVKTTRRSGIGRTMVEMLRTLNPNKRIFAITRASNKIAQNFYEGLGFVLSANLPGLYDDEDARMYILHRKV